MNTLETLARPAVDLTREEVLDPDEPSSRRMLEGVQGNVLKAFARKHTDLLLLHFTAPPQAVRAWVRICAQTWVTSAWEQHERGRHDTGVLGGLSLTAAGYRALGFSLAEIESRFGHSEQIVRFSRGMAAAGQELNDPPARDWEPPYRFPREAEIHAMLLLASDRDLLSWASRQVERSIAGFGRVLQQEKGAVLGSDKEWTEPFGFVDGHSQPIFLREQLEKERSRGGVDAWNPVAPLGLALTPDPFADGGLGSYLVFRKLRQDVDGFRRRISELAARFTGGDERLAEALVVGRFRNGTPLVPFGEEKTGPERQHNNFNYAGDALGLKCPFHAHLRKTNPRDEAGRSHRIVRRGVPYKDGDGEQGLLFLCFQSRIHEQFAHIQARWANDPRYPRAGVGVDPLIGSPGYREQPAQRWPFALGGSSSDWFDLSGLVTLKGGEFFFAPSLQFLTGL